MATYLAEESIRMQPGDLISVLAVLQDGLDANKTVTILVWQDPRLIQQRSQLGHCITQHGLVAVPRSLVVFDENVIQRLGGAEGEAVDAERSCLQHHPACLEE